MKLSHFLIPTQKEVPNDAQIISHQLMIRAGLISKLATGLYTWLPLGLMVVRHIEGIIREEMNKSGAQELLMPIVQPTELWEKTGRINDYGAELLTFVDRHHHGFCLGPTHEEIITQLASQYINSYKQLPINFYQIQTKFRDEIRPRFGVMRAREFIMKDAYSFHLDEQCLQKTYKIMQETYCRIFERLGLDYRCVLADSGTIGGDSSHEFHVLADSGEDAIAFSDESDYAANVEQVETLPGRHPETPTQDLVLIDTPEQKTIDQISQFLNVAVKQTIKTLIVKGNNGLVALVLRGDHALNNIKAEKIADVSSPLVFVEPTLINQQLGCEIGSIGVVNLHLPIIVDYAAATLTDFICGANINDKHYTGVNWTRDTGTYQVADLRNAVVGDDSPDGKGKLIIKRGIEVGHIFQLGTKYADKLNANVIDQTGRAKTLTMGCYGIGVTRLVAAIIEQNYDDWGIIFPESVAPAKLIIVPINYHKSHRVKQCAEALYGQCLSANIQVMLDDRKERAGILFAQSELLGIPHRVVISDSLIDAKKIEYKARNATDKSLLSLDNALVEIKQKLI